MVKRVLIANRGEIALRIIRACRELDIETVAVYSQADESSLAAQLATQSLCIGPARAADSYLNQDAILSAALAGGLAAFLIYNFHPAKVFMGDTGSLFLGGMVCGLAFALDIPLVIPVVGLVYVVEVLSDIIQVVYFKKTHGKRFFRMAPLHHHFEMGGWSETKLFCVFSGVTLALCCLGFLGVMYRYPM